MTNDEAEIVALAALKFLASDADRFARFMALSGVNLEEISQVADNPDFLAGVLAHLLGDESLLFLFIGDAHLAPEDPGKAHRTLSSSPTEGSFA